MSSNPSPIDETRRLAALHSFGLLDSAPETVFDHLTQFAAEICDTPIALISLIDATRQWFKSNHGLEGVSETPREVSFCTHAIDSPELMLVPDATKDERFVNNPLVTGEPNIRFYAGMPLRTRDGHNLGTLCVIDRRSRELTPVQARMLEKLAHLVVDLFELRSRASTPSGDQLLQLLDSTNDEMFLFDTQSLKMIFANETARQHLGYDRIALLQVNPAGLFPQLDETSFRNLLAPLITGERRDVMIDTVQVARDGSQYPVRARVVLATAGQLDAFLIFSTLVGQPIQAVTAKSKEVTVEPSRGFATALLLQTPRLTNDGNIGPPRSTTSTDDPTDIRPATNKSKTRQDLILESAQLVLMEDGYAGFSLRKVAKRAGISIGNLQYHFPAKTELLEGVMDSVLGACFAVYERHVVVIPNPRDRLVEAANYLLNDRSQNELFRLLREMWALAVHDEAAAVAVSKFNERWRATYASMIKDVNPALTTERADALSTVAVSLLSGAFVGLSSTNSNSPDQVRAEIVHTLLQLPDLA